MPRASLSEVGIFGITEVIANGYRGEISVLMNNMSSGNYHILPGDRVAQLVVVRNYVGQPEEVKDIRRFGVKTPRGEAGPGSTGR